MRPGPGLVVMALAFISGARRGSTNTSSTITTSAHPPPPPPPPPAQPHDHSHRTTLPTGSILFPAFLGGGGVFAAPHDAGPYGSLPLTPPPSLPTTPTPTPTHQNKRTASSTRSSPSPSPTPSQPHTASGRDHNNNQAVSFTSHPPAVHVPPDHLLTDYYEAPPIRTTAKKRRAQRRGRRRRRRRRRRRAAPLTVDDFANSDSDSGSGSHPADVDGLWVHFASPHGPDDGSRSIDEDDILALVAEDDFLSEESFDRLATLTAGGDKSSDDDDYGGTESNGPGSGGGISERDLPQQDDSRSVDEVIESVYAAHLVGGGGNNNEVTAIASGSESDDEQRAAADLRRSIFQSVSPLTRLNPWISACDLAQPGTAPDLQGECSAGTLPVAWVDEGPGPPTCPISCEELRLNTKDNLHNNFNTNSNNNNNKFTTSNGNLKATKMRRDVNGEQQRLLAPTTTTTTTKTPAITTTTTTMDMQQDDNGGQYTTALHQQHQSHNNNNIVKLRAGNKNSNNNNNNSNKNNNNYDWKLNDKNGRANTKSHQQRESDKREYKQQQQQTEQEQEYQQCLHYLGDSEHTTPAHLCGLRSPSELVERLRTIRLRHCCERNVFSALHTVALNVTLGGGDDCTRILTDIMELDSLASRITCELAEILFRFDCRQAYSLVNQCDDCKAAYRRWVCSTLVPYFAEQSDVIVRPSAGKAHKENAPDTTTTTASANTTNGGDKGATNSSSSSSGASASNKQKQKQQEIKNLYTGNGSNNKPQHSGHSDEGQRQKRYISGGTTKTPTLYDVIAGWGSAEGKVSRRRRCPDGDAANVDGCRRQQSTHFISTANSEDPVNTDPVISKLLKRTKRKVEFRKRRRIRPCLSVCQTVERKCPYLLPADRAPALPTQYAGEPTFLCLDQNIPETGEQLRKSGHGPTECCYEFCDNLMDGLCTYCTEFAEDNSDDTNKPNNGTMSSRLHNITMSPTTPQRFDTRLRLVNDTATNTRIASISIALKNLTDATALSRSTLERLNHYAHYDGLYYYDDMDDEMPGVAVSENCPYVPSVSSRCTIPYYASSATSALMPWGSSSTGTDKRSHMWHGQKLLIWLSAILCVLSGYNAAQYRGQIPPRKRRSGHLGDCMQRERELWLQSVHTRGSSLATLTTTCHLNANMSGGIRVTTQQQPNVTQTKRCGLMNEESVAATTTTTTKQQRRQHESDGVQSPENFRCNDLINFSQTHFSCRPQMKSIYYRSSRCNRNSSFSHSPRNFSHLKAYASTINNNNNNNGINNDNWDNAKTTTTLPPPPPPPRVAKVMVISQIRDCHHCCNAICNMNYRYRYFYYLYNFNINDWWRRWCKRKPTTTARLPDRSGRRKTQRNPVRKRQSRHFRLSEIHGVTRFAVVSGRRAAF